MRMLAVESDIDNERRLTDADLLAILGVGRVMARRMDGSIQYWGRGCERLYGHKPEDVFGRSAHTLLSTVFPVPLEEVEASLLTWGEWHGDLRQTTKDGRDVIVAASLQVRAFEASPTTVIETLTDVTAYRLAEVELRRSRALLSSITETTSNLVYAKDLEGRTLLANAALLQFLGMTWQEVEGKTATELLRDQAQAERIIETDRHIMASGRMEEVEEVVRGADQRTRVMLSAKAPMRNDDGDVIGLVGVSVDITDRKRNEERLGLLVNELNHRVKNTLATVQSIAFHTWSSDHDRFDAFTGWLQALSAVHDVLARASWRGVSVRTLVECALDSFGEAGSGRFLFGGPELVVKPKAAIAFSLGLHELLTSAVAHGALSQAGGHVAINWRVDREAQRFEMRWREHGGPRVRVARVPGFGARVLERLVAKDLGGACRTTHDPGGATCDITAAIGEIACTPGEPVFPLVGSLSG